MAGFVWWSAASASTLIVPTSGCSTSSASDSTTVGRIQWNTPTGASPCDLITCDCDATGAPSGLQTYFGPVEDCEFQTTDVGRRGAWPELALRARPELVEPNADALRCGIAETEIAERERARVDVVRHDREAAERRARELLESHLTAEQRRQLERLRCFRVVARSGRVYEIDAEKRMHNVYELDGQGRRVNELCIYQMGGLPLCDNTLAQKLLLEADEAEFRRIANHTRLRAAEA